MDMEALSLAYRTAVVEHNNGLARVKAAQDAMNAAQEEMTNATSAIPVLAAAEADAMKAVLAGALQGVVPA